MTRPGPAAIGDEERRGERGWQHGRPFHVPIMTDLIHHLLFLAIAERPINTLLLDAVPVFSP
jgi:hypothetical protein